MRRVGLKRGTFRLKRVGFKRKPKKRATPDTHIWKEFGLTKPPSPRYKGLKGILWYVMSRAIRLEEWLEYGKCVSCPRKIDDWHDADCGHFRAASRGMCTLFERKNLALQCKKCNNPTWSPDAAVDFGIEIDRRYGKGTAEKLVNLSFNTCPEPSQIEYSKQIKLWITHFEDLQKEYNRN